MFLGKAKKDNGTFANTFSESGLALIEEAVAREHAATLSELVNRLNEKKAKQQQQQQEKRLLIKGAKEFRDAHAERERKRAVRVAFGMLNSMSAWRVSHTIVLYEDKAVRNARKGRGGRRIEVPAIKEAQRADRS